MGSATYDTGALIAAERGDRRVWARHQRLVARRLLPTVPAAVLAEAWRGGARQANLVRLLDMCDVEALTEEQARDVGTLAGKAQHHDVVDVSVVEGAVRRGDAILTSDPDELHAIARAASIDVVIEPI